MAWPLLSSPPPTSESLSRRLRKLDRVFSLDTLRGEPMAAPQVVAYYEECWSAYRKHHSPEGAMHMAISEGERFHPEGFHTQLHRIAASWSARTPGDVLELGFGQGFNLAHLGSRFPAVRFSGIDITPAHHAVAGRRIDELALRNVTLTQGDFHVLPYADASFDHVYSIEAFCYARDLDRAFGEIARVLRPGGTVTLFDGYLARPAPTFSGDEALATELVAKGMAVDRFQCVAEILEHGRKAGLADGGVTSFDAQILPNLRRLERLTGAVIRIPWLGRRALARRSPMRGRNVISGYLLHSAVSLGLMVYREIVLRKPG
jgi:SAM-dependent methyltransferase